MEVSLQAGRVVGEHWRLKSRLGVEGTSRFWEAEDLLTGGQVVIEFSSADFADPAAKLRFSRETRVLTSFRSTHVVRTLHRGLISDDLAFAVTELLHGEDLSRLLARESALELTEVAQIVDQTCRGISRLDTVKIAHRVLEPKHVFLLTERANARVVKLLNAGLGRGNARSSSSVSPYMSPERVSIAPQVWAIGVIAYRMLSGALPFVTDDQKTRDAGWQARFAHLRAGRIDLPRELGEWFQTALHPDPGQRFATVEQAGLAFGHIASTYASGTARLRRLMERTSPKPPPLPSKSVKPPASAAPLDRAALSDVDQATEPSRPRDREPAVAATASEHAAVAEWNPPAATGVIARDQLGSTRNERAAADDVDEAGSTPNERAAAGDVVEVGSTPHEAGSTPNERAAAVDVDPVAATASELAIFVEWDPPAVTLREYTASAEWDPVDATPREHAEWVEWDPTEATTPNERDVVEANDSQMADAHAAEVEPDQAALTDQRRAVGLERSMNLEQELNTAGAHERTTVASRVHASAKRRKRVAVSERTASLAREHGATEHLPRTASVGGVDRAVASHAGPAERRSEDATVSVAVKHGPDREHLAIVVRDPSADAEHSPEYASDESPSAALAYREDRPARDLVTVSESSTLVREHVRQSDSSAAERARALRAQRDRWRVSAALAILLGLVAGFALRSLVSNQHRSASRAVEPAAARESTSARAIGDVGPQPTAAATRTWPPAVIEPAAAPAQSVTHARSSPSKRSAASALTTVSRAAAEGSSPEFVATLPTAGSERAPSSRLAATQLTEDPANAQRVATHTISPPAGESSSMPSAARPRDARLAPATAPNATPVHVYRGF